jgi:hypothetical protein
MVTIEELTNAIGKPMNDAAVETLVSKLGPGTRKKGDLGVYHRYKTSLEPKGGGLKQYAGEIPFGVRLGQPREEIRAALGEPTKAVATIADEYDQGLWTFRVDYDDAGVVERIILKAE